VALETGEVDLAMIPIENTLAGRVADIHYLLPLSRLHIVGEYFMPIRFQLMVLPGVKLDEIRTVHSPYPCTRPVPQDHPQPWLEGGCRRRYGRGGQAGFREG
jgi:prephenate dehydratase